MGEKRNHPKAWQDGGKGVGEVGDQLRQEWDQLKAKSDGMGDIFGDDMVGALLGASYQVIMEKSDESFGSTADDYTGIGEAMTQVGKLHADTQQSNIALIKQIEAGGKA